MAHNLCVLTRSTQKVRENTVIHSFRFRLDRSRTAINISMRTPNESITLANVFGGPISKRLANHNRIVRSRIDETKSRRNDSSASGFKFKREV